MSDSNSKSPQPPTNKLGDKNAPKSWNTDFDLSKMQDLFKVTLEGMHEGIQILDQDLRYIYINEAAAKHGLRKKEDLVGRTLIEMYPNSEGTDLHKNLTKVIQEKISLHMENYFEYPDNKKAWFELYFEPHPIGVLIRSLDITKRKEIELQLYQSQKIDSIGVLAGGIAHDFNNKLGIMTLSCEMAMRYSTGTVNPKLSSHLEKVLTAVEDSKKITKQLLAFSRKQVFDIQVLSLNELLVKMKPALIAALGEKILIKFELFSGLENIKGDSSQLSQVIWNACMNSRDAIASSGEIFIKTQGVFLNDEFCKTRPHIWPGKYVQLTVSDNGVGMSPEELSHIFEPFFTTKKAAKAAGLGLSSVHGIVTQSNGHIEVSSEKNVGTSLHVYLPVTNENATQVSDKKVSVSSSVGNEKILLVEDDSALRTAFKEVLENSGYSIDVAETAEEALNKYSTQINNFNLLLSDIVLPNKNGFELAESLKKIKPNLKVIFVSGYTQDKITQNGAISENCILIEKPVKSEVLLSTLRLTLDGKLQKGIF